MLCSRCFCARCCAQGRGCCARVLVPLLCAWALLMSSALLLLSGEREGVLSSSEPLQQRLSPPQPYSSQDSAGRWDSSSVSRATLRQDVEWALAEEPKVDLVIPTQEELFRTFQQKYPNIPISFWAQYDAQFKSQKPRNCSKLPNIYELEYNNNFWQLLRSSNGTFQLYGAYYDVRKPEDPLVRILGMINRLTPMKTHCQLWFQNQLEPVVSEVTEYRYIWVKGWGNGKDGLYQPYLFTCHSPKDKGPPVAVSIVESPCDRATNALRVIFESPNEKKNFAVCVKGLDYFHVDLSVRLVEWIELLHLLGADKVVFYELSIHPNISKILDYYVERGLVEVNPLTLPALEPNLPILQHVFLSKKVVHKRQNEVIPYNDCFYRNMYSYKYITLLDIDEVIMPLKTSTWSELMADVEEEATRTKNKVYTFYGVRNVYYLDDVNHQHSYFKDIPRYMHMLQHVYRSKNFTKPGAYVKGFHNTDLVVTLHNHFPRSCLNSCQSYSINVSDAHLQHFRSDCVKELLKSCGDYRSNSVIDTNIWKFKKPLIENVVRVLKTLKFF